MRRTESVALVAKQNYSVQPFETLFVIIAAADLISLYLNTPKKRPLIFIETDSPHREFFM